MDHLPRSGKTSSSNSLETVSGLTPGTTFSPTLTLTPSWPHCPRQKAAVSVEDTFTAQDGGVWAYTFDALKAAKDKKQVQWGKIIVTESSGNITKVECDPEDESGDTDKFEVAPTAPAG